MGNRFAANVRNGVRPRKKVIQKRRVRFVRVFGNLGKQMPQIFVRLETVRFSGFHDAVNDGANFRAFDGIHDAPVGASHAERTNGSFAGGVVNRYASIL